MKKPDPSLPYVQPHWPHIVMICMFSIFAVGMLALGILQAIHGDLPGALVIGLFCAGCAGLALLFWHCMYPRYTVTTEGIEFYHKRKGWRTLLPWSDFTHMYTLAGSKSTHLLFSAREMDKSEQYAACKARRISQERPVTADGCLILSGAEPAEIIARVPEHIVRVPEWKCCSFWDGYILL